MPVPSCTCRGQANLQESVFSYCMCSGFELRWSDLAACAFTTELSYQPYWHLLKIKCAFRFDLENEKQYNVKSFRETL